MGYSNSDSWNYQQTATNAAQVRAIEEHLNRVKFESKNGWRIR